MELKIDPELDDLFSDLKNSSKMTYEQLKDDIKKNGIKDNLVVSQDGIIVCGHQRFKIAQELKIPENKIPYVVEHFKNKEEMIERAVKDNLLRRQMNKYTQGLLGLRLLSRYQKEAKQRMKLGKSDPTQNFGEGGEAIRLVADKVRVSHETLRKVQVIEQKATSDQKHNLMIGKASVSAVYDNIKNKEKQERIEKEMEDDASRRLKEGGHRFKNKVEDSVTKQLNIHLMRCLKPNEEKAIKKDVLKISYDWFTIVAKTEEAKRVLSRFEQPDDDTSKKKPGNNYALSKLQFAIDVMSKVDAYTTISLIKNKPLTIENKHFKIMILGEA